MNQTNDMKEVLPSLKCIAQKEQTTYEFEYNENGYDFVTIVFENGVFKRCDFPFNGTYTRNQWKILAAIESKIANIEEELGG